MNTAQTWQSSLICSGDHVQVKTSGSAQCARVVDLWLSPDGTEFAKVEAIQPLKFTGSYPTKAVRRCSGLDGLCICAGEAGNASPEAEQAFAATLA